MARPFKDLKALLDRLPAVTEILGTPSDTQSAVKVLVPDESFGDVLDSLERNKHDVLDYGTWCKGKRWVDVRVTHAKKKDGSKGR